MRAAALDSGDERRDDDDSLPSLVVGLLAGVFVDRHDRKRIMIVTCLVQAVIVATIAVVIGIDGLALPGEEDASVAVIVANLKSGLATL
ncbi:MAG: hypothetical protein WKF78_06010 [Candidatus Limnocylindrales bacterium]